MPVQPHLHARPPSAPITEAAPTGLHTLPIGGSRDSYIYVPDDYQAGKPMPAVLLLHGAGGSAHDGLRIFLHQADQDGLILIAPASAASSWDIIVKGAYGADVDLADKAMAYAFAHYAIDPGRIAVGGFSDGASYALTLGLANGDLFTHVMAFSPGFIAPMEARDSPKVLIAHGTHDKVLPIDACSRRLVPVLRAAEYALVYHEFEGPHEIPADEARFALDWFALDQRTIRTDQDVDTAACFAAAAGEILDHQEAAGRENAAEDQEAAAGGDAGAPASVHRTSGDNRRDSGSGPASR